MRGFGGISTDGLPRKEDNSKTGQQTSFNYRFFNRPVKFLNDPVIFNKMTVDNNL